MDEECFSIDSERLSTSPQLPRENLKNVAVIDVPKNKMYSQSVQ